MTLVLSAGVGNKFVIMTSDYRQVMQTYTFDRRTGIYEKEDIQAEAVDGKSSKIVKISNSVLLATGGISTLGIYIKDEMSKRVAPFSDLSSCKKTLEILIQELRTEKTHPHVSFLDMEKSFQVIMSGFYYGGDAGIVSFVSGEGSGVDESRADSEQRFYSLIPPVSKYLDAVDKLFEMQVGKLFKKSENVKNLRWIHGLIASAHPNEVSSDGEVHVLTMPTGTLSDIKHVESRF